MGAGNVSSRTYARKQYSLPVSGAVIFTSVHSRDLGRNFRFHCSHFLFFLFLAILGRPAWSDAADGNDVVQMSRVKEQGGENIYLSNTHPVAPYHWRLQLDYLENMTPTSETRLWGYIEPGKKILAARLESLNPKRRTSFRVTLYSDYGIPGKKHNSNQQYLFPWAHGIKHSIIRDPYAWNRHHRQLLNFDLKLNEDVMAARRGVVIDSHVENQLGKLDPDFSKFDNFIRIMHDDGSVATYNHLAFHGSSVRVGQQVALGEVIGRAGGTGETSGPYLGFRVTEPSWSAPVALAIRFMGGPVDPWPLTRSFHYSQHPGLPPVKEIYAADLIQNCLKNPENTYTEDDKVRFVDQRIDDVDLIFLSNGKPQAIDAILDAPVSENVDFSKKIPFHARVLPLTRRFMFYVRGPVDYMLPSSFKMRLKYRVEGPGRIDAGNDGH
jgi:murein DD-endopeptidase MepM/ murein hydrolase activator NlpD